MFAIVRFVADESVPPMVHEDFYPTQEAAEAAALLYIQQYETDPTAIVAVVSVSVLSMN